MSIPTPATAAQVLAGRVSVEAVRGLMTARPSALLTREGNAGYYAVELHGMATEVAAITGDPVPDAIADLAVRCVTLGVAFSLEQAAYPEQQLGDAGSRSEQLRARFLAVRADLLRLVANPSTSAGNWSGYVDLS